MARKKSIHYVNNAQFSQAVVDFETSDLSLFDRTMFFKNS